MLTIALTTPTIIKSLKLDLSPLGWSLVHAWEACGVKTDDRTLARHLRKALATLPTTHVATLGYINWLNADMVLTESVCEECTPFILYRDELVARMNKPAQTLADLKAQMQFLGLTEKESPWCHLDAGEAKSFLRVLEKSAKAIREAA